MHNPQEIAKEFFILRAESYDGFGAVKKRFIDSLFLATPQYKKIVQREYLSSEMMQQQASRLPKM